MFVFQVYMELATAKRTSEQSYAVYFPQTIPTNLP